MKAIGNILLFVLGIGSILFAAYTFLFIASDTRLVCLGDSKTCTYKDTALLWWVNEKFNYNEIKDGTVQVNSYYTKGSGTVYYYTTQIVTDKGVFNVKENDSEAEATAYANQIDSLIKDSKNPPSLMIEFSDRLKRINSSIMLVIIGFISIGIGIFKFIKGK